ncbi:MAG: hypothetical protein SF187_14945 [Deltaproteobacteria bacterium]|nr:hypothetical protein [Deltaproteobacteria bacterium]
MTTLKHLPSLVGLGLLIGACGSADDNRPADWDYIAPAIIIPNCATSSCHSEAAAAAGLDMSTPAKAYRSLTGLNVDIFTCDQGDDTEDGKQTCAPMKPAKNPSRALILPGNPAASRTVSMMRARGADRMPPDRPLADGDIALFEEWIALGAKR